MATILLVDDNEPMREIAALALRSGGYEIIDASTGSEAIEKASANNPHLILMDIDLPDMSGNDAVRVLKSDPVHQSTPVIGWSALLGRHVRQMALEAGMDEFLVKPVSAELLLGKMAEFIKC